MKKNVRLVIVSMVICMMISPSILGKNKEITGTIDGKIITTPVPSQQISDNSSSNINQQEYIPVQIPTTQVDKRGTRITIKYAESIPNEERKYMEDLFDEIYPLIEGFAGEPYQNQTLTIKYEEGVHTSLSPDLKYITLGKLPDPNCESNPWFDSVMIVELFHTFIKGTEWGEFARPYEYYSWAIANLISEYTYHNDIKRKFTPAIGTARSMKEALWAYEDRRELGSSVYNGGNSVRYYNNLFLDQISNMFTVMLFTQSESMENLDFYKCFNSALYKYTDQGKINAVELAMNEVQKQKIEGMDLYEWFIAQPYKKAAVGKDYAFELLPVEGALYYPNKERNYNRLYIFLMKLGKDGGYQLRTPIEEAKIEFEFYDDEGQLLESMTKRLDMKSMIEQMADYIEIPISIRYLPYIRVVATTVVDGQIIKAEKIIKERVVSKTDSRMFGK